MQVVTNPDGSLKVFGSVNHAELARLKAAARKRKSSEDKASEPKPEPKTDDTKAEPPVAEQKSEGRELPKTEVTSGPPKPASRGK